MIFEIVLIGLLSIVIVFLTIDAYYNVGEWAARIHIGRWDDRKKWQRALENKAWKWLEHTPAVRTSNNSRLLLLDIIHGKFRNPTVQSWQDAGLLLGLGEAACTRYQKLHPNLFNQAFDSDYALLAYALKIHSALTVGQEQKVLSLLYANIEKGKPIPYRPHVENLLFVDTIGMVVPFLHSIGLDSAAELQIKEYDKALFRGVFPAHAYNLNTSLPLGVYDWARGIGWYIMGLVFSSDVADHKERIVRLAGALLPLQKNDGGYSCFVFNPDNRMESSGSALIGLLMVNAYQITNDDKFKECAFRIEKALMHSTRRDGSLDYCQADTQGTGFYSHVFSTMPFAQGMTLTLSKILDNYEA